MSAGFANSEEEPAQASSNKLTQLAVLGRLEPPFLLPQRLPDRGRGLAKPPIALRSTSSTAVVIHKIAPTTPLKNAGCYATVPASARRCASTPPKESI